MLKKTVNAIAAGVCLAIAAYSFMGVLQAALLFDGERAIRNYQFWAPLSLVFLIAGIYHSLGALRIAKHHGK